VYIPHDIKPKIFECNQSQESWHEPQTSAFIQKREVKIHIVKRQNSEHNKMSLQQVTKHYSDTYYHLVEYKTSQQSSNCFHNKDVQETGKKLREIALTIRWLLHSPWSPQNNSHRHGGGDGGDAAADATVSP
jgi:hypothetical protein